MKIKFVKFMFAWYDCFMGIYIDRKKKLIYILYFPMCGVVLSYYKRKACAKCGCSTIYDQIVVGDKIWWCGSCGFQWFEKTNK